jgi:hypothetical protein
LDETFYQRIDPAIRELFTRFYAMHPLPEPGGRWSNGIDRIGTAWRSPDITVTVRQSGIFGHWAEVTMSPRITQRQDIFAQEVTRILASAETVH